MKYCKFCGDPLEGRKRTFCSDECAEQFKFRNGVSLNELVWQRDQGVCSVCGLDTEKLQREVCLLSPSEAKKRAKELGFPNNVRELVEFEDGRWEVSGVEFTRVWWKVVKNGSSLDHQKTVCIPCFERRTLPKFEMPDYSKLF
jgi:hypothetical protein